MTQFQKKSLETQFYLMAPPPFSAQKKSEPALPQKSHKFVNMFKASHPRGERHKKTPLPLAPATN